MRNVYVLVLMTLAGSAQAITWAEYYAAHQAEVNAAVVTAPHHLDLGTKGLTDLNGFDAVPGLNTLEGLYLHGNQLRELPPTIFQNLNMLRVLFLSSNQLRELPPTIFQGLNTLQGLYLHENQLRELPPTIFQGLNALQQLSIDHNQLREISPAIFQDLNALQGLALHHNQLIALPSTIFQGLSMLQRLALSNNELIAFPPTIFQGLNTLQGLNLSNNQLREFPPTIFRGLNSLRWLYFNNNQLRELSPTMLQGLNALQKLYLDNNRILGTTAKLRATLQLPNNVDLRFKTPDQEQVEALFTAIGQSNVATVCQLIGERIRPSQGASIVATVFRRIGDLLSRRTSNPQGAAIPISTLRDYDGNNLLHAAIISAARHLASIKGKSLNVQGSEEEKSVQRAKLAKDKAIINASYMKIINTILTCGQQCAQEMLATPNAEGQSVVRAAIAKLGLHNSPITEALLKLGLPEINVKAKLESYGSAAAQRLSE